MERHTDTSRSRVPTWNVARAWYLPTWHTEPRHRRRWHTRARTGVPRADQAGAMEPTGVPRTGLGTEPPRWLPPWRVEPTDPTIPDRSGEPEATPIAFRETESIERGT